MSCTSLFSCYFVFKFLFGKEIAGILTGKGQCDVIEFICYIVIFHSLPCSEVVMTFLDPDDSEQSQTMLGIMLRTLRLEAGDSRTERMDPLLRELMVTALQRSQDERDRDNLTPPKYR